MYSTLYHKVLVRTDAERAHTVTLRALQTMGALPGGKATARRLSGANADDPRLAVTAFGIDFPHPLGLAAGFDKDAHVYRQIAAFGFGHVEIGTLTAHGQPGNDTPRLFRLPADDALLNRMGFNNGGSQAVADRLRRNRQTPGAGRPVLGVNIGKTKLTPDDAIIDDYTLSTQRLAPFADYLVVNVSSPNTPGLRDLQAVASLRPLLAAVREQLKATCPDRRVPLLVKIAPDLADADIDEVADLAVELGLEGIIATNTTISRDGLRTDADTVAALGPGGISGAPVKARAVEVLHRLYARVGDRITLVGVGGIATVDDAWERIRAGATLIQAYTGLVYGGPMWPGRIVKGLAERVESAGYRSITEVVGAAHREGGR